MDYKTILRHHLATLAFRINYAIKDAQDNYSYYSAGYGVRLPGEIIQHVTQMLKASDDILNGREVSKVDVDGWENLVKELHHQLATLDKTIENLDNADEDMILRLYQGPLSDAMTHVGQLMTLRRMSNDPLDKINFYREDSIKIGKFDY